MSEELKKETGEISSELGSDDLAQVVGGATFITESIISKTINKTTAPIAGKEVSGWDIAANKQS